MHFLRKNNRYYEKVSLLGNLRYNDDGSTYSAEDNVSTEMAGEQNLEDKVVFKEDLGIMMKAIGNLPEREIFIIKNRYGLNGGDVLTQEEVGRELGMTQANVSKLEASILAKLKVALEGKIDIEGDGFYRDYAGGS